MCDQTTGQSHPDKAADPTRGLVLRFINTLIGWAIVYLLLLGIFGAFGALLETQPFAIRLMIVSALLVVIMANLVMPQVDKATRRWIR